MLSDSLSSYFLNSYPITFPSVFPLQSINMFLPLRTPPSSISAPERGLSIGLRTLRDSHEPASFSTLSVNRQFPDSGFSHFVPGVNFLFFYFQQTFPLRIPFIYYHFLTQIWTLFSLCLTFSIVFISARQYPFIYSSLQTVRIKRRRPSSWTSGWNINE